MMRTRFPARWLGAALCALALFNVLICAEASGLAMRAPAPLGTVCDGDGKGGKRIQLLYVHTEGGKDRFGEWAPKFQEFAGTIDDYVNRAAKDTGGERHLRYVHDSECKPVVDNVALPDGDMASPDSIAKALTSRGYDDPNRNYQFWYERDGCGVAFGGEGDDSPGEGNGYNKGGHFAAIGTSCWSWSASGHELLHALGAVQESAPHATKSGHCWDDEDIMCYDDGGVPNPPGSIQKVCDGDENQVDCKKDDYFNVSPPGDSYLAKHWNLARSKFLIGS